MSDMTLAAFVKAAAEKFAIRGVAAAAWADGAETYACHGVTSLKDPQPVNVHTLYSLGSISKTFTATAMMRPVAQGKVDLDAPVRRYIPELVLPNEQLTSQMTVLNLLNHTAGLDWRLIADTGDGDEALGQFVARLAGLEQLAAPGTRTSYRRHGHNANENGQYAITRQWKDNRANNPGGGVTSSVADQLRWARFHLGDGRARRHPGAAGPDAAPDEGSHGRPAVQHARRRDRHRRFLRDVDGVRTVGHGGSGNGQLVRKTTR